MEQRGILFVCTDNASRSQMAEALARQLAPPAMQVFSAGTAPTAIHPCTIRVLREIGIDPSRQRAKGIEAIPMEHVGAWFTLDSNVARPALTQGIHHFYAPFDDPAGSGQLDERTLERFRALRDQLQSMLAEYFRRGATLAESSHVRRSIRVRSVQPAEVASVLALLRSCRLPVDGIPADLSTLLVAVDADRLVGSVGLERHGADVLLRSLAVAPGARDQHIASSLCDEAETRAQASGAGRVFLLTETAERFFEKRGYDAIDRSQAPAEIAASREFSAVCPVSAVLMVRDPRPRDSSV